MELLIIIVLLVIAAETTYLTYTIGRKNLRMQQAPAFIDTSVLIDGRIISIAESGFMTRPLYIPRSVVGELQFLADNADTEKRTRARHGLDVISQLQAMTSVRTLIFNDSVRAEEGVDNRLLALAKKHGGALCTIDYNLNKVAVVEGIEVLNVNELAKSLRMAYLPGEHMMIELTQKGNDQHQGVGHLSDGTMVVVEHAFKQVGKTVEIEFIRGLQTAAGKMMFAKLVHPTDGPKNQDGGNAKNDKQSPKSNGRRPAQPVQATARPPRAPRVTAPRAPQEPQASQVPQAANQSQAPKQARSNRSNKRRNNPEDSLVELANR